MLFRAQTLPGKEPAGHSEYVRQFERPCRRGICYNDDRYQNCAGYLYSPVSGAFVGRLRSSLQHRSPRAAGYSTGCTSQESGSAGFGIARKYKFFVSYLLINHRRGSIFVQ